MPYILYLDLFDFFSLGMWRGFLLVSGDGNTDLPGVVWLVSKAD